MGGTRLEGARCHPTPSVCGACTSVELSSSVLSSNKGPATGLGIDQQRSRGSHSGLLTKSTLRQGEKSGGMCVFQLGDAKKTFWGTSTPQLIHLWELECERVSSSVIASLEKMMCTVAFFFPSNLAMKGSRGPTRSAAGSYALSLIAFFFARGSGQRCWFPSGPCVYLLWSEGLFWETVLCGFLQLTLCMGIFPLKQHVYKCQPFVF